MQFPKKPPLTGKHVEQRLTLAASGFQALTSTLLAVVPIGPHLNASLVAPFCARALAAMTAGSAELSAFLLLHYIPVTGGAAV